jgi:hypothetical protein
MFLIKVRIFSFSVCRTSDSTVSEDGEIEPRTVATTALADRRSNPSAGSHPQLMEMYGKKICQLLNIVKNAVKGLYKSIQTVSFNQYTIYMAGECHRG